MFSSRHCDCGHSFYIHLYLSDAMDLVPFTSPARTHNIFASIFITYLPFGSGELANGRAHTIVLDYISDVSMATCVRRHRRWLHNKYAMCGDGDGRLTAPIVLHLFDCCLSSANRIRAHTHTHKPTLILEHENVLRFYSESRQSRTHADFYTDFH